MYLRKNGIKSYLQKEKMMFWRFGHCEVFCKSSRNGNTRREEMQERLGIGLLENPTYSSWDYIEMENTVQLTTQRLILEISKSDAAIRYYDSKRKLLIQRTSYCINRRCIQ